MIRRSAALGSRTRGPTRYDEAKALGRAVRDWCLVYLAESVRKASEARGEVVPAKATKADGLRLWTPEQEAHMKRSLRYSNAASGLAVRLLQAAREADRFLQGNAAREIPYDDGAVRLLERFLNQGDVRWMLREVDPPEWSPRALLVLDSNRGHRWWWTDREPTTRDLAVLSLLVGHGKEWARKHCATGRPTVLDAVRAEERALGQHKRKYFPPRPAT